MTSPDARSIAAVYMRGGTSRALVFHREDLPPLDASGDRTPWNRIFLRALGSPDPAGRQLDGMGGGVSSLSKIAVVGPPTRDDADVDYTFAQVGIDDTNVSYKGNCGNISAAIGPFAVDEGMIATMREAATVRIHNTNTGKLIHAVFPLVDGRAAIHGDCVIQGVAGSGAPIQLRFVDPAGAVTGALFPTGATTDTLAVGGLGRMRVSLVDAANPVVFVLAPAVGMTGDETPEAMRAHGDLMANLQALRVAASLAMGVARSDAEARTTTSNLPLVAILSPAKDGNAHIGLRMMSAGLPHKATPLTGAMCVAIAASIAGTLVHEVVGDRRSPDRDLLIAHPSGVLPVAARVIDRGAASLVCDATVYRTARRLMEGRVFVD